MNRRIAIVTPWYGPEAAGGAESLARELAGRLARIADVTLLTTTSRAFLAEWDVDHFPAGESVEDGYRVRRFPVDRRDRELFDRLNAGLLQLPRERWFELLGRDADTRDFIDQSINSTALEEHLRRDAVAAYDAVVFLPYLYGVVVRGIEAYPGPAHLLPCLHDEAYARIPRIEAAHHAAASLLFNSAGEAAFALQLYGPGVLHKTHVIGSGVPPAPEVSAGPPVDGAYFLYLGRRDATKNVDTLVEAFRRYRSGENGRASVRLVLAGPGHGTYDDPSAGILDLGFIDEATKFALLRGALALAQPSTNESYSRVLMEAWREGVPVAVDRRCLATTTAVLESGGGYVAGGTDEWTSLLARIAADDDVERAARGERGLRYAEENADWSRVVDRLVEALGLRPAAERRTGRRVDQVLQTLEYGDAISDEALHIQDRLRELGYESTIHAEGIGPLVLDRAVRFEPENLTGADALVYHHSIRCGATAAVISSGVPKALIYHNITPARFFAPYRPDYAELLDEGIRQTAALTDSFDRYYADSAFNAGELHELGARDVRTLPVVVDFRRFDRLPDPAVIGELPVGARWLFVGRVAPNKGVRRLLEAFDVYLCYDAAAILKIVGRFDPADAYYQELRTIVIERRLENHVRFLGMVDEAQLLAHYRTADVYVSMSEHEGFCVPLVEAMWFDLPVIALGTTAVPETMGEAGILVADEIEASDLAVLVREVIVDAELRRAVIASQRERRLLFTPERVRSGVDALVADLLA